MTMPVFYQGFIRIRNRRSVCLSVCLISSFSSKIKDVF